MKIMLMQPFEVKQLRQQQHVSTVKKFPRNTPMIIAPNKATRLISSLLCIQNVSRMRFTALTLLYESSES